jgi:hypothetical protein
MRANAALTSARCARSSSVTDPIFACAYRHYLFNKEGYRYRGRIVGSTWGADAEVMTAHLRWTRPSGDEWRINLRHGTLNRGVNNDIFNIDAPSRRKLDGVDLEYRLNWGEWGSFRTGVGVDRLRNPVGGKTTETGRWFLMWNHKI